MDLCNRMALGGRALLALLDPEHELMPTGAYEVAHDLGRWWDAVLRLEETIGFVIPPELEAASLRNLKLLADNPDGLLLNRLDVPWLKDRAKINPHNFRESLIAYGGLVRCRDDSWARGVAMQLVGSMDRCLRADGSLDFTKLGNWGRLPHTQDPAVMEIKRGEWFDSTPTTGRSLEALVWLYETTGEQQVLDVARRIAEHHLDYSTSPDGAVREEIVSPDNVGHRHSYLGTLRGLLLFGLLTGQKEYVDTVEATYRNSVRHGLVKESGWAPHDLGKPRYNNDYGDPWAEPASTGDAAQLALWLALRAGCDDLLDDVERYVRARLVPVQLTEEDVRRHPEREFAPREIGAWPSHFHSHAGKGCMNDVLAAVTHSLCDIYSNICTRTDDGLQINLHFDYEDAHVRITSKRDQRAELSVQIKQPGSVTIRVPQWAPDAGLRLTVDGEVQPVKRQGMFVRISEVVLREKSRIDLSYDLPLRRTEEPMPSGRCYTFKWRGDEIVGIHPQDNPLPFYPEESA